MELGAGARDVLLDGERCLSNNGTQATPCLSADILGDWREEVTFRAAADQSLRIYTTTAPAKCRFPTQMHDPHRRLSIAWQNAGCNQPPHAGFFPGEGCRLPGAGT